MNIVVNLTIKVRIVEFLRISCKKKLNPRNPEKESGYMENYKPFISEGGVSLVGDESSSQKVKILRDTGATQSLMLDIVLVNRE